MKTIKIKPRGYCHGVVNAIKIATESIKNDELPKPIYILGMIVHNNLLIESLTKKGIITIDDKNKTRLELLDDINEGTVIFTAHGVGPSVYEKAERKGLMIVDATCKNVFKSQDVIRKLSLEKYEIVFIGKKNHPEVESALDINRNIHIVENIEDTYDLDLKYKKIAVTSQTTMSIYNIKDIVAVLRKNYSHVYLIDEICDQTRMRQMAVKDQDIENDLCLIVGDKLSNNSNKLVEVAKELGIKSYLIESVDDIDIEWLMNINTVSVSSGASTPTQLTNEVIEFLEKFDPKDIKTHSKKSTTVCSNLVK